MDPAWKAKWVAALRDPANKQAQGRLKSEYGGYCCLGLACEISGVATWDDEDDYLDASFVLPPNVRWAMELDDCDPRVPVAVAHKHAPEATESVFVDWKVANEENATVSLSTLNDQGATFAQIANIIEEAL